MISVTQKLQAISFEQAVRIVLAGLLLGIVETIFTVSIVSLIFQGDLTSALPLAIGIGLVSQVINLTAIALFSKAPGIISTLQDNPAVLLTVIVGSLAVTSTAEIRVATVFVLIMLTTILTGLMLIIIGQFRLGQLGRYIPYPVIGGFLAGTGWLLFTGSFGLMANVPLTLANLSVLLETTEIMLWLPGVVLGLAMFVAMRRFKNPRIILMTLFIGILLFYAALLLTGTSVAEASSRGYLLDIKNMGIYWQPPQIEHFTTANWNAIVGQLGNVATIALLTMVALLLNISGLELALQTDIDLNHELRTAGYTNLVMGLLGGFIGYHGMSFTMMGYRIAGRERLTGVIAGIFGLLVLLFGTGLLAYVPRPLLGGLIFYLGIDFMYEWIVDGYKKFSRLDYSIVVLILLTIIFVGFLVGVALGLVLMILLFVVNYSRISIYHYRSSGAETTSNVQRTAHHQEALQRLGQHTEIMELRGFIFFGTVNHLLELVRQRYQDEQQPQLKYLVLDFRRVTGIDSSAIMGFQKLRHIALTNNFTVLFTQLPEATQHHFVDEGIDQPDDHIHAFPDLDHALEWCENALLEVSGVTQARVSVMLEGQLEEQGFDVKLVKPLRQYLERRVVDKGEYLMRQGDDATDMFFIEIGQVSVVLELPDNQTVRLRTMQMGTVVGEVGFYLKQKRSASIVADTKAVAHRLSQEALARMKEEQPQLAIALDEMMIRIVAERLARNNRAIEAYSR